MTAEISDGAPVLASLTDFVAVERTFPQMLCERAESEPDAVAYQSWSAGTVRTTSWREYLEQVREVALGLHHHGVVARLRWVCTTTAWWRGTGWRSCPEPGRSG